ncbi:MAG: ABC transporter permease [Proteobacteria bacterium]|nr:ABC transporter permease [Pseudomonadota bacterium]
MTIIKEENTTISLLKDISLTALFVFIFTTLIITISGAPPFEAYENIIRGSFGSFSKFGQVIKVWIPLTLCSCGLLYTFKINLWNIGIEGQMIMGAVFGMAAFKYIPGTCPAALTILIAFMAGLTGGAIWALFAGFLKTFGGVNEIFAGLGMNFVAQSIILWLIFGPWKREGIASMSGTEQLADPLWLSTMTKMRISPTAIALTVASILITAFILKYTKVGLGLKAIGNNMQSAFMYKLKPTSYMLLAMIFAGGFAGLAGTMQVTGVYHRLIPTISSNYGYLALFVVMLANYNVWAVPLVALFFACLNVGSIQLPMVLQIDSSLSGVIQGALVLATLGVQSFKTLKKRRREYNNSNGRV